MIEPSGITFSVSFTGTPSASDIRTGKWIVARENERRAAMTPPQSALPTSTSAELKASIQTAMAAKITLLMIDHAVLADKDAVDKLDGDVVRDFTRAITDKLNAGKTAAQIVSGINAI